MSRTVVIGAAIAAILAGAAAASQKVDRSVFASPLLLMSPSVSSAPVVAPTAPDAEPLPRRRERAEIQPNERQQLALIGLLTMLRAKNAQLH